MASYAMYEDYVLSTGDNDSSKERVEYLLAEQSAELRAQCGLTENSALTDDQKALCRKLVIGSVKAALVSPLPEELGDMTGAKQASFSANGFQGTLTMAVSAGTAFFDRATMTALKKSLGRSQSLGIIEVG